MRVLRGRADDHRADRDRTAAALDAAADGEATVRAWTPHRQVAFGPRDARADGYDRARRLARRRGYRPLERAVGGRAVAFTGRTVAFARATPVADPRSGIDERYDRTIATLCDALAGLGADVQAGEPPDSFCPGAHSVRVPDGPKVAGVAQRVTDAAALVSGVVLVDDRDPQRAVLADVYGALGLPLDPAAVGDVASAGAPDSSTAVARAVEAALVGDHPTTVERVES